MALDYYKMIKALFGFKEHLDKISNEKFQILSNYIVNKKISIVDCEQIFPDTKEISKSTGLARQKVTSLVQELYVEMLEYFSGHSLIPRESIQIIYIHFPYDEEHTIHKNYKEEARRMSLWFQVQLQVVPRLGEAINLDFIEGDLKYNHGTVVEIDHDITCHQQTTIIHVHPIRNFFYQWDKLRKKHERSTNKESSQRGRRGL